MTRRRNKMKKQINKIIKTIPYIIVSVLVGVVAVYAGSLTPPGAPAKSMKSLADLYQLVNTGANTPSTDFTTPSTIAPTMTSLGDTYDLLKTKITAIDTTKILTGTTIFGKAGSASAGNNYGIPKTGQQPTLPTGTPFQTGDDATYANPGGGAGTDVGYPKGKVNWAGYNAAGARFTDNTDGTITDNATGLEWMQTPTTSPGGAFASTMTWANAITNCEGLTYPTSGGHTDWRLPNVKELQSIVDYGRVSPSITLPTTLFPNTQSSYYWSSTTYAYVTTDAWSVVFVNGYVGSYGKASSYYVRCVRG